MVSSALSESIFYFPMKSRSPNSNGAQSQEMLLKLPPELLHRICEDLSAQDGKSLRLTCTQLSRIVAHSIFRNVTIDICRSNVDKALSKLVSLAQSHHPVHDAARYLKIFSLSPVVDRDDASGFLTVQDLNTNDLEPAELTRIIDIIKTELPRAVSALQGVQTVFWAPEKKDGDELLSAVLCALGNLPNLRKIIVTPSHCDMPLSFQVLGGLQALSFHGTRGNCADSGKMMFDNLAKTLAALGPRHPGQLTSLWISHHWKYGEEDENQSFCDLFKYYPRNAATLRLRQLILSGCFVSFKASTLPHLKYLTHLELSRIDSPSFSQTLGRSNMSSDLGGIWNALRSIQVRLKEIKVDFMTSSFVAYLSSYSGLEKLQVTPSNLADAQTSNAIGHDFYEKALISHVNTLKDLEVRAPYEGSWCFGSHNVSVVSKLTKLEHLRVGIIPSQLWTEQDYQEQTVLRVNEDPVHLLLEALVPPQGDALHLKTLCIVPAEPESLRSAECGNGGTAHRARVCKQLGQSVRRYRAPPSCSRLPTLFIGERDYPTLLLQDARLAGQYDFEDGSLRYVDISPRSHNPYIPPRDRSLSR